MIVRNVASRAAYRDEKMGKADVLSTDHVFVGLNGFEPGQEHQLHTHEGQDKIYYVLEGDGRVTVGDVVSDIAPGDLVLAPSGEEHALKNVGQKRLLVMVFMSPNTRRK